MQTKDELIRSWLLKNSDCRTEEEACNALAWEFLHYHIGFPETMPEDSFWVYKAGSLIAAFIEYAKMGISDYFYSDRVAIDPADFIKDVFHESPKRFKNNEDDMQDYIAFSIFLAIEDYVRKILKEELNKIFNLNNEENKENA